MSYHNIKLSMHNQPFMVDSSFMEKALSILNGNGWADVKEPSTTEVANNNVTYEQVGKVAVISIDGAMYKRDMNGSCGETVVSYPAINKAIDTAENDDSVEVIFFRVDTPGGSVAGADETGDKIFNSKKRTVVLYENMGASGGIYVFSSADELYATETTVLGSIGVIVTFIKDEDDKSVAHMVSKRAENKVCNMDGDCLARIQTRIDKHEQIFYDRVTRNTGFSEKKIMETFNNGDVIFADEAAEAGFIKQVTTFQKVLKMLVENPIAEAFSKIETTTEGVHMEFNQENFDAVLGENKVFKAANATLTARVTAKEGEMEAALTQKDADHMVALSKAVGDADAFKTQTHTRLQEAVTQGVDVETAMAMVEADSDEAASKLALDSDDSQALPQDGSVKTTDEKHAEGIMAYAKQHEGSIK